MFYKCLKHILSLDLKELFETWKKQQTNKHKIISVDEDFYSKIAESIKQLEEEIKELKNLEFEDAESFEKVFLKREKALMEFRKVTERIFKLRTMLLLSLAFKYSEGDVDLNVKGLSKEEKILLEKLVSILKDYRVKVLKKVLKGESPEFNNEEGLEKEEEYWILASKSYIPQFIGSDLKTYGPFEPEEVFCVPKETAEVLIKKDKAKLITKV